MIVSEKSPEEYPLLSENDKEKPANLCKCFITHAHGKLYLLNLFMHFIMFFNFILYKW